MLIPRTLEDFLASLGLVRPAKWRDESEMQMKRE